MTIDDAEMNQNGFISILDALNNQSPKAQKYIAAKNSLLNNAKIFYKGRENFFKGFKDGIFPLNSDDKLEEQQTSKKELPNKSTKTDFDEFNEQIIKEEADINKELFENFFKLQTPSVLLKTLYNLNDKNKNNMVVYMTKSGLSNLKNEIKKMSEDEIKIEKPYKLVDIV